jgi:hypothetical protein
MAVARPLLPLSAWSGLASELFLLFFFLCCFSFFFFFPPSPLEIELLLTIQQADKKGLNLQITAGFGACWNHLPATLSLFFFFLRLLSGGVHGASATLCPISPPTAPSAAPSPASSVFLLCAPDPHLLESAQKKKGAFAVACRHTQPTDLAWSRFPPPPPTTSSTSSSSCSHVNG